jgi:hypothetical protein
MLTADGAPAELLATDAVADQAQELELVHGEGPLHDATLDDRAISLAVGELEGRWPSYAAPVSALGVHRVTAVPLRSPGTTLGAIGLFSRTLRPASVDALQHVSDLLVEVIVDEAPEVAASAVFGAGELGRVHQAAGMLSARLGCDVAAARALIRARAFADESTAAMVAQAVLEGELDLSL